MDVKNPVTTPIPTDFEEGVQPVSPNYITYDPTLSPLPSQKGTETWKNLHNLEAGLGRTQGSIMKQDPPLPSD